MALSGNLKEFELADVFQLIGQQRKTGILTLRHKNNQGAIVFSEGNVIAASSPEADLSSILFTFLSTVKKYPLDRIQQFYDFCKQNDRMFADILLKIQYLNEEELSSIATMSLKDIACSLFRWRTGFYRFIPHKSCDEHSIHGISLQTDAVAMEAMRRNDEWPRMRKKINDSSVFFKSKEPEAKTPRHQPPHKNTAYYLYTLIDGKKSIKDLCEHTFLCKYRIYETLYHLLESRAITTEKKKSSVPQSASSPAYAFLHSLRTRTIAVALSLLIAILVVSRGLLPLTVTQKEERENAVAPFKSALSYLEYHKLSRAWLRFFLHEGIRASSINDLKRKGYLSARDYGLADKDISIADNKRITQGPR